MWNDVLNDINNKEEQSLKKDITTDVLNAFIVIENAMMSCASAAELSINFIKYQNILQESFLRSASKLHQLNKVDTEELIELDDVLER